MNDAPANPPPAQLLPVAAPGHWVTDEGREIAAQYIDRSRETLCKGGVSDFELANAVFMASRNDLDLIVWQTAAKERIRWLSAQLALAQAAPSPERGELASLVEALAVAGHAVIEAMNLRALRGRDHVPSMRAEQEARIALSAALHALSASQGGEK